MTVINKDLFNNLSLEDKQSLIRIMFNLNFNLTEPEVLSLDFLKLLHKTYEDIESLSNTMPRKIISIVVVASALEENHLAIIDS